MTNHCGGNVLLLMLGLTAVRLAAADAPLIVDKASSRIEIVVKATADSFVGRLADYTATGTVDPATCRVTAAQIGFNFADVKTGNEKRDAEMHLWQQTAQFPKGSFSLTSLEPAAAGKFTAHGTLVLHGVSHELVFPVTVIRDGAALSVDGEAEVDTRDFGLPLIRKFVVLKVDPIVGVRFHLAGAASAP